MLYISPFKLFLLISYIGSNKYLPVYIILYLPEYIIELISPLITGIVFVLFVGYHCTIDENGRGTEERNNGHTRAMQLTSKKAGKSYLNEC